MGYLLRKTGLGVAVGILAGCGAAGAGDVRIVREGDGIVWGAGIFDGLQHTPPRASCSGPASVAGFSSEDVETSLVPRESAVGPVLWIRIRPEISWACPQHPEGQKTCEHTFSRVTILDRPNLAGTRPANEVVWWAMGSASCDGREHRSRIDILYRGIYDSMGNVKYFGPLRLLAEGDRGKTSSRVLEVNFKVSAPSSPPHVPEVDSVAVVDPE